jgi:hypothetical protein
LVLSFKKELLFEKRSKNFCYLVLVPAGLVLAVHWPALGAYFAADDFLWLPHHDWSDAARAFSGSWGLGTAYRPLTRVSFVVDAQAFGMNAWPWHLENITLHAAAAVLLGFVALQAGFRRIDAMAAALLFAAMPLAWENADWISGRTGEFMVVLGLLCTLFWLKWLQGSTTALLAATLCQAAALLCYEQAAVLPLALLAAVPAMRFGWRRAVAASAALGLVVLLVWAFRSAMLGTVGVMSEVPHARIWPGLARNLAGIAAHGWSDFGAAGFAGACVILFAGLKTGRTRRAVAGLLLAAFVLYLPFWMVAGVTERFFYASGVPLALALVVASRSWLGLRPLIALLVLLFAVRAHADAEGVRAAGRMNRAMLTQIAAMPNDGRLLVFDAVPTHLGKYYLLWGAFETATGLVRPPPGLAARSETVIAEPALLRRAMAGPSRFLRYDAATGGFADTPQPAWLARATALEPAP